MNKKRDHLYDLLEKIWDNEDFLLGINGTIRTEKALDEMIQYLEENKDIELDPSDVTKKSLYIRYGDSIRHILED